MKKLILVSACVAATYGAFAQAECVRTAATISGNQMTLTTSGAKSTTTRPAYVYYERKLRKRDERYAVPGVAADRYASEPLLLNATQEVVAVPEKYNVSVAQPLQNATACADSAMVVDATLKVERVVSFTGNYPASRNEPTYREVSKRQYKMAARKKRKIERKQEKIARRAEVKVDVRSTEV